MTTEEIIAAIPAERRTDAASNEVLTDCVMALVTLRDSLAAVNNLSALNVMSIMECAAYQTFISTIEDYSKPVVALSIKRIRSNTDELIERYERKSTEPLPDYIKNVADLAASIPK